MRGLGTIQFVGELFKLRLMSPRIVKYCCIRLLGNDATPDEEDLEVGKHDD
jgi:translation initiation factor 4G